MKGFFLYAAKYTLSNLNWGSVQYRLRQCGTNVPFSLAYSLSLHPLSIFGIFSFRSECVYKLHHCYLTSSKTLPSKQEDCTRTYRWNPFSFIVTSFRLMLFVYNASNWYSSRHGYSWPSKSIGHLIIALCEWRKERKFVLAPAVKILVNGKKLWGRIIGKIDEVLNLIRVFLPKMTRPI